MQDGNWTFTEVDMEVAKKVSCFLPARLFDIHAHVYRVRDLGDSPPEVPAQGPETVTIDVWRSHLSQLVGGRSIQGGLLLPYPTKGGNIRGGNEFLISQLSPRSCNRGLVVVAPDFPPSAVEEWAGCPHVVGFKPYHVFAATEPTFDAAVEAYVPEWIWELANHMDFIIMLHLVRPKALSDPDNQRTILTLCKKYPRVKLILAHAGRGFHAPNTIAALPALRELQNVWFDTSAICEPDALMAILKTFGSERLLWGSDFPVSQQRGKCVTVGDAFSWICPRRIDRGPGAPVCRPILVGLESLRALSLAAQLIDLTARDLENIFARNALQLLGLRADNRD